MPSAFTLKTMNAVHRAMLKVSFGRVGWTAERMPMLELTTTGRKTGQRRTVLLTSPVRDGAALVIVASQGGDDRSPAWFLNLVAHPEVEVAVQGGPAVPMTARVATTDERPVVAADHCGSPELRRVSDQDGAADPGRAPRPDRLTSGRPRLVRARSPRYRTPPAARSAV